jgi:hypothetical protein
VQILALVIAIACALLLVGAAALMILSSSDRGIARLQQLRCLRRRKPGRFGNLTGTGTAEGDYDPTPDGHEPSEGGRPARRTGRSDGTGYGRTPSRRPEQRGSL